MRIAQNKGYVPERKEFIDRVDKMFIQKKIKNDSDDENSINSSKDIENESQIPREE
jgi:hypothetical protein